MRTYLLRLAHRYRLPGACLLTRRLARDMTVRTEIHNGTKLCLDPCHPAQRGMIDGTFERYEQSLLVQFAPLGAVVIDIGAHIGYHTVALARSVGPTGHVYAVEPLPANQQLLQANIAGNGLANVTVTHAAVSDLVGTAQFAAPATYATSMIGALVPNGATATETAITVDTTTVDAVCRAHDLARLDLVKVDAEGAELQIIAGMRDAIRRFRPVIMCELDPDRYGPEFDPAATVREFAAMGYTVLAVGDGETIPVESIEGGNYLFVPDGHACSHVVTFWSH